MTVSALLFRALSVPIGPTVWVGEGDRRGMGFPTSRIGIVGTSLPMTQVCFLFAPICFLLSVWLPQKSHILGVFLTMYSAVCYSHARAMPPGFAGVLTISQCWLLLSEHSDSRSDQVQVSQSKKQPSCQVAIRTSPARLCFITWATGSDLAPGDAHSGRHTLGYMDSRSCWSSLWLLNQQDTAGCHTLLMHRENGLWAYCKTGDSIRPQQKTLSHHDRVITEKVASELWFYLVHLRLPSARPEPGMHLVSLIRGRLGRGSLWPPSLPPAFDSAPQSASLQSLHCHTSIFSSHLRL